MLIGRSHSLTRDYVHRRLSFRLLCFFWFYVELLVMSVSFSCLTPVASTLVFQEITYLFALLLLLLLLLHLKLFFSRWTCWSVSSVATCTRWLPCQLVLQIVVYYDDNSIYSTFFLSDSSTLDKIDCTNAENDRLPMLLSIFTTFSKLHNFSLFIFLLLLLLLLLLWN